MSVSATFHSSFTRAAKVQVYKSEQSVWIAIDGGDGVGLTIFLPADHPDAHEAGQAIANIFNSLAKPAVKEAA